MTETFRVKYQFKEILFSSQAKKVRLSAVIHISPLCAKAILRICISNFYLIPGKISYGFDFYLVFFLLALLVPSNLASSYMILT